MQINQTEVFGCEIDGFADYYPLENKEQEQYIVFYHCIPDKGTGRKYLKAALVYINPHKFESYAIYELDFQLQIPYDVIDLDIFRIERTEEIISFHMVTTYEIPESYSNVLGLYIFTVDTKSLIAKYDLLTGMSASTLYRDTF
jgi:hypothetical protein